VIAGKVLTKFFCFPTGVTSKCDYPRPNCISRRFISLYTNYVTIDMSEMFSHE
jgi:hypothetical protein